jgi:HEAT repeat protein
MKLPLLTTLPVVLGCVFGCSRAEPVPAAPPQVPLVAPAIAEVDKLFMIAADRELSYRERHDAIKVLGEIQGEAAVDHLTRLLPGEDDLVSLAVIAVLSDTRDPRALARLLEMRDRARMQSVPGQISAALRDAINKLQRVDRLRPDNR